MLVIAVALFHKLGLDKLFVKFGTTKNYFQSTVLLRSLALSVHLHFSSYMILVDVMQFPASLILERETWGIMTQLTAVFNKLSSIQNADNNSMKFNNVIFSQLQRFVTVMYSRSSPHTEVNKARRAMFAAGRSIESIPPTEPALLHVKCAILQLVIWKSSLSKQPDYPPPDQWG